MEATHSLVRSLCGNNRIELLIQATADECQPGAKEYVLCSSFAKTLEKANLHDPRKAHHGLSGSSARGGDWDRTGNSLG